MSQEETEKQGLAGQLSIKADMIGPIGGAKQVPPPDLSPDLRPGSLMMIANFLGSVLVEDYGLESATIAANAHGPFFYVQFETDPSSDFQFEAFFDAVEKTVNAINPGSRDLYQIQCDRETRSVFAPRMDCFAEFLRPLSQINNLGLETEPCLSQIFLRTADIDATRTIYTIDQIEAAVRTENMAKGLTRNPDNLPVFWMH